jgi:manganese/zinc/iron transport system permease protein
VLAIVIGIRSVGVVLMAGMLIAPAVTARQFAKTFGQMFMLATLFGVLIGFFGMGASVSYSLPTGPVILVVATLFAILALLFSGKRGLVGRVLRRNQFKRQCLEENVLKYLEKDKPFCNLREVMHLSRFAFAWRLMRMRSKGLLKGEELTDLGRERAIRIIRLHRLWEVYLFRCLDVQAEDVHKSAEEMEHAITPELEEELVRLLGDPKRDPHNQEIPR